MTWKETIAAMDWVLMSAVLLLTLLGLAMFFSATYTQEPISFFFVRQGVTTIIGAGACFFLSKTAYHSWRRFAILFFGLGIALQLVVSLTGRIIRGTVSRLEFFGVQLQPSEFIKIVLLVVLSYVLARQARITLRQLFLSLLLIGPPVILVLLEPDLGMAALMIAIWAGMLVFWGLSWRIIFVLGLIGVLLFGAGWHFVFRDYQKARITSFLHPTKDPLGAGYNMTQSIVALGSGQFFGRGLGHGPQSQLKFLPERHTDFILASIGEELGFVGLLVVILLYAVLIWRILNVARLTSDPFGQLLCVGASIVFMTSLTVSAGMNMGLLPVTGIPLSFVSYGGSNLLASFILLGLVQSIRVHSRFAQTAPIEISHIN